jgi:endogenous inhibitor of DNA gyrase (YacG/DUF329 family)
MVKCETCGKEICSDRPLKCPFCGHRFIIQEESNTCPTCNAGFRGLECPHCGDELNGYNNSSFYQDYIDEQFKKK